MSTCPEIEWLACHGLRCLQSLTTGDDTVRVMYVSEEIWRIINPPFSDDLNGKMHAEFRQTLDAFLEGAEFTVAEDPYVKPPDAMIARVDPVGDEIWDIRSVYPSPGIRALGGFWCLDTFVALTWDYRENYNQSSGQDEWAAEINRCRNCWRDMFGSNAPFKGKSLDEYLTNFDPV